MIMKNKYLLYSLSILFILSVGNIYAKSKKTYCGIDSVVVDLMSKYNLPAATIAVVKDEQIAYVTSYGMSDIHKGVVCSNDQLYRIASISKPITLVGILLMIERGELSFDSKVFGQDGVLGNDYGEIDSKSSKALITIRHLIEHKSGWQNNPNDPMFAYNGMSQKELIAEILKNRELVTSPGENYYYSNFGYLVLGRVIEKISGMPYYEYIKANILKPAGIKSMVIGGNTLAEKCEKEVRYYHEGTKWPYSFDLRRMDSHGGWLASAEDLAKFMVVIDRGNRVPDILSNDIMSKTYLGFPVWNHSGSLPGTSSILMRIDDNTSFVLLANARSHQDSFWNDFINKVVEQIKKTDFK